MSPALLSKRLKDLEAAGVVTRIPVKGEPGVFEYRLTEAGQDCGPLSRPPVYGVRDGSRAKRRSRIWTPNLLTWDIRRNIDPTPMSPHRNTIQVIFNDLPQAQRNWWLVVEPDAQVDLCSVDPGFDVDLYLSTDLRTMTEIWMGYTTTARAKEARKLTITGNRKLEAALGSWLSLSPFAKVKKLVA